MTVEGDAKVRVIVADYAAVDPRGKLNVLGGNISFLPLMPHGLTPACAVAVQVEVPNKHAGQEYDLSLDLYDQTAGQVVMVDGPGGTKQAMRVQQVVHVQPVQLPGVELPGDYYIGTAIVLHFAGGLALTKGHTYDWRVHINAKQAKAWMARFHVLDELGQPIFGGPGAPDTVPGVGPFIAGPAQPPAGDADPADGKSKDPSAD